MEIRKEKGPFAVNVPNTEKRPFLETMNVRGRTYHYFRIMVTEDGARVFKRTRLPGAPGSPEFEARYEALASQYVGPKPERVSRRVKPREIPSRADLQRIFAYSPDVGELRWHNDGSRADVSTGDGRYRQVSFMGKTWLAHRVIWKLATGSEPDTIDHINGDGNDNRFANLRSVTPEKNSRNRALDPPKHGVHGVIPFRGKWKVQAGNYYIGVFKSHEDAVAARRAAEKELGFHANHGRLPPPPTGTVNTGE
jgi:hypothetical protein